MKASEALYRQIYNHLLAQIKDGVYEDKRLPTEKEITEQFFVSRITARKALDRLAADGMVVRISGKGTFVRKGKSILPGPAQRQAGMPLIALVMGGYSSSFGMGILNAAIDQAEREGVHIILKNAGNSQAREFRILEDLKRSGVDGIIVQPAHGEIYSQWLINAAFDHYPIVMIDRFLPGIDMPFVGVDNERLSETAANHLIEAGHRNICLVTMEAETASTLKARMEGFKWALNRHKIPVNTDLWLTNLAKRMRDENKNSEEAYAFYTQQIVRHLKAHPEITAVFCTEYLVSRLVYKAIEKSGMRVPEDYSIVGFDGEESGMDEGFLAHVRQPQSRMGEEAVKMVCAMIRGEKPENQHLMLDGEWVEGRSVAEPSPRR